MGVKKRDRELRGAPSVTLGLLGGWRWWGAGSRVWEWG